MQIHRLKLKSDMIQRDIYRDPFYHTKLYVVYKIDVWRDQEQGGLIYESQVYKTKRLERPHMQ